MKEGAPDWAIGNAVLLLVRMIAQVPGFSGRFSEAAQTQLIKVSVQWISKEGALDWVRGNAAGLLIRMIDQVPGVSGRFSEAAQTQLIRGSLQLLSKEGALDAGRGNAAALLVRMIDQVPGVAGRFSEADQTQLIRGSVQLISKEGALDGIRGAAAGLLVCLKLNRPKLSMGEDCRALMRKINPALDDLKTSLSALMLLLAKSEEKADQCSEKSLGCVVEAIKSLEQIHTHQSLRTSGRLIDVLLRWSEGFNLNCSVNIFSRCQQLKACLKKPVSKNAKALVERIEAYKIKQEPDAAEGIHALLGMGGGGVASVSGFVLPAVMPSGGASSARSSQDKEASERANKRPKLH